MFYNLDRVKEICHNEDYSSLAMQIMYVVNNQYYALLDLLSFVFFICQII